MNRLKRHAGRNAAAFVAASVILAACGGAPGQTAEPSEPERQFLEVPVTMSELMNGVLAPAANTIWEYSYAAEITDENWQEILNAAIQLAAVATPVSLGGAGGADSERAATPEWQGWTEDIRALALEAKTAAENRDQMALASAGDQMVDACALCHDVHLPGAAE